MKHSETNSKQQLPQENLSSKLPDVQSELKFFYGPDAKENPRKENFRKIWLWWQDFSQKNGFDYALAYGRLNVLCEKRVRVRAGLW
jgi:hypothetical protein